MEMKKFKRQARFYLFASAVGVSVVFNHLTIKLGHILTFRTQLIFSTIFIILGFTAFIGMVINLVKGK